MRVITGNVKGHKLKAPKGMSTRPTSDRVKESIFNIIGYITRDSIVLDLFAGSGTVGIEFLRMAAIHTPTAMSNALGIVAGILVGQIAIDVGLFTPEVILYVAVAAIGSYATPSYELSLANKLAKLVIILFTFIFGLWGLIGSVAVITIYLAFNKSFGKPYFYPLIPFKFRDFIGIFIRVNQKSHSETSK